MSILAGSGAPGLQAPPRRTSDSKRLGSLAPELRLYNDVLCTVWRNERGDEVGHAVQAGRVVGVEHYGRARLYSARRHVLAVDHILDLLTYRLPASRIVGRGFDHGADRELNVRQEAEAREHEALLAPPRICLARPRRRHIGVALDGEALLGPDLASAVGRVEVEASAEALSDYVRRRLVHALHSVMDNRVG